MNGKDLVLIGELHIYSAEESKQAESLLEEENPDIIFAEGVNLKHFNWLVGFVYGAAALISRRKHAPLLATARKQGRKIVTLERGYDLPPIRKTSLVLILMAVVAVVSLVLLNEIVPPLQVYIGEIVGIIRLSGWVIGVPLLLEFLFARIRRKTSLLDRMVLFSTDKDQRDHLMVKALTEFIGALSFRKAFVVVGKFHLNHIEGLLKGG